MNRILKKIHTKHTLGKTRVKKIFRKTLALLLAAAMLASLVPALTPPVYAAAGVPLIIAPPSDATYSKNAPARFSVSAVSPDGGSLTYQWYISIAYDRQQDAPNVTGKTAITTQSVPLTNDANTSGATSAVLLTKTPTFSDAAAHKYYYYWCEVTNHKFENGAMVPSVPNVSYLATVKVVNRTLPDHLVLGDLEDFEDKPHLSVKAIDTYWPIAKYPNRWNSTTNEIATSLSHDAAVVGKAFDINLHNTFRAGWIENWTDEEIAAHGTYSMEIAPYFSATAYQEIATVPRKIYEWGFDHAARRSGQTDIMAQIIGPAINAESDYGQYTASETNYWNRVSASTNSMLVTDPRF